MTIEILILAGLLHLTAPATTEPQQYAATAYAMPGVSLSWRGWDGWVQPHLCYDRCSTTPGQPAQLLRGELSEADAADLQLTLWRLDGTRWVQVMHCARWFDGRPICATWGAAMNAGAIILLLSLAGNAALGWAYLGQRDETTAAMGQRDTARSDASACSDATEALRDLAAQRAKAAAPARAAAATAARTHQQRADYTLGLQPRKPADLCASMQALGDEWLQGRARP